MKIYHYSRIDQTFVGEGVAKPDPLEHVALVQAHLDGGGDPEALPDPAKFLIPAHATTVAPPATKDGEVATFNPDTKRWSVTKLREPQPAQEA